MEDKLISVIVPVYNVEKYLKKCISSIISQTYKNIEIILVDDGSTDKSGIICERFSKKDKRVTIKHIENLGVSNARNIGIEISKGDLICFVDSDDFLPNNSLEILYLNMINERSDLSCGKWRKITGKGSFSNNYETKCIDTSNTKELIKFLEIEEVNGPVAKLFKREIIAQRNIRYKSGVTIGEDAIFNFEYIKFCKIVSFVNDIVYHYNKLNANSATHNFCENFADFSLASAIAQSNAVLSDKVTKRSVEIQKIFSYRFLASVNYYLYYDIPLSKKKQKISYTLEKFCNYLDDEILKSNICFSETKNIVDIIRTDKLDAFLERNSNANKSNLVLSNIKQMMFSAIAKVKLLLLYRFNIDI